MATSKAWAVIAGVGPGTGACIARKFSQQYSVALLARKPANFTPVVDEIQAGGGKAIGISADVADPASMKNAFQKLQQEMGDARLAAAVYNVGGGFVRKPFLELTTNDLMSGIESNVKGGFIFSQAVLPLLLLPGNQTDTDTDTATSPTPKHPPTLIFTSATAAMKGSAQLAAFSTGKFALKSLAQSLAREFGPKGVHVAQAVIDGVIDIEKTKAFQVSDAPDSKISPLAIADAYWYLHTQPRSCFTHEIDIRPYVEKW